MELQFYCVAVVWGLLAIALPIQGDNYSFGFDFMGCGYYKQCYVLPPDCQQSECSHIIATYVTEDEWINFELFEKISDPKFNTIGIGFSKDNLMGDEMVTYCLFDGEGRGVHLSYNEGKTNVRPENWRELEGNNIRNLAAYRGDDFLYCKFRQRILAEGENGEKFSLVGNITMFLMHSVVDENWNIQIHSLDRESEDFPHVFPNVVNFTWAINRNPEVEIEYSLPREIRRQLLLLHGCLMVTGWMFLIAVGISASRYLKIFHKDKKPHGIAPWFQIHRGFNVAGVILIVMATAIVFFANDFRWSGPLFDESFYRSIASTRSSLHSLTGIVAVAMALLQPIGALFRCHPRHNYRKIFNVLHHTVGKVSFGVAMFSLMLAVLLFRVWYSRGFAIITLLAYCGTGFLYVTVSDRYIRLYSQFSAVTLDDCWLSSKLSNIDLGAWKF
uniref:Cytochrome b561 domain-containing protein n=1 Tax=Syphacia muris TaxID=451379 RepID=A0A0N5AMC7_9BILA